MCCIEKMSSSDSSDSDEDIAPTVPQVEQELPTYSYPPPGVTDAFAAKREYINNNVPSILPNWLVDGQPFFPDLPSFNARWRGEDGRALIRRIHEAYFDNGDPFPMVLHTWDRTRGVTIHSIGDYIDYDAKVTQWIQKTINGDDSALNGVRWIVVDSRLFNELIWCLFEFVMENGIEFPYNVPRRGALWWPLWKELKYRREVEFLGQPRHLRRQFGGFFGPVESLIRQFSKQKRVTRRKPVTKRKRKVGSNKKRPLVRRSGALRDRPRDSKGRFLPMRRR